MTMLNTWGSYNNNNTGKIAAKTFEDSKKCHEDRADLKTQADFLHGG